MEKFFKLKAHGTTVRTEIVAGVSTFMTMAYIIALNPTLISGAFQGEPMWNAVFLATILSSAIGTFLMGLLANQPFALAPGMGLNSYFAGVVASIAAAAAISYEEAFPAGLAIILISGVLFTTLTLFKIREKIVDAIPTAVRLGIPAGIGLMLINIGLTSNAGIFSPDFSNVWYMLTNFFSQGPSATAAAMGEQYPVMILYVLTFFVGLFAITVLHHKKVKGSVLLGMAIGSVVYWIGSFILGSNPFASLAGASFMPPFADMLNLTFFKFNFKTLFSIGIFSAVMTIITFCMIDMFDTIGTLYGTAKRANMLDENDKLPNMNEAMLADALATCAGACTGTSTVTTYIESAAGVEEGGRTGLTSIVTGVLFLLAMFLAPIAGLIPAPATSAALVFVGVLMMGSLKEVDYTDVSQSVPVVLLLIFMLGTSGIGNGIGIGLIAYSIIKLLTGKSKEVSLLTIILSLLFIAKFFVVF
ncbi:MAG: NCS2 family permease [Oscillospiraceae bacterium]